MPNIIARLCLVGTFVSAGLLAADITGIWTGQVPGRDGVLQDLAFRFVQTGDQLTGKMYGDNASIAIADAKIAGDQITFIVRTELNGQINRVTYTGTVNGNEMRLKREREGGGGGNGQRNNQNAPLVLKKLG